jgi:adenosylcobinamide-phosphate synthase
MTVADSWTVLAVAILLDGLVGDPDWLWRRAGHPVAWIGNLIAALDRRLNRDHIAPAQRRAAGIAAVALLIAIVVAIGLAAQNLLAAIGTIGWLIGVAVVAVLLAGRSLVDHVAAVAGALDAEGLETGRNAVSRIVGRDPDTLGEAGVSRAAMESAAENLSDGFVAPAFWYLLLGLPGLLIYKAVNTADSMIGHRTPRHGAFGWAAARLDDLLNWPAARLTALLIALAAPMAGGSPIRALAVAWRDGRRHASPNAGWPEAAMAGALGLRLGGDRWYGGVRMAADELNPEGRATATPQDIRRSLRVTVSAAALLWVVVLAVALH